VNVTVSVFPALSVTVISYVASSVNCWPFSYGITTPFFLTTIVSIYCSKITGLIGKYLPESIFGIIDKYVGYNTINIILKWVFVIIMIIFLSYITKFFIKKKKI
jgi:uncharacterized membrane protein required for colicin V production